jgi:hypothetical protein
VPPIYATGSGSLPTPTVGDSRNSRNATADRSPGSAHHSGITLSDYVTIWPTPNARDHKRAPGQQCQANGGHQSSLPRAIKDSEGTGQLNPEWVEWLMGYPPGWTDSADSGTPSSPKSPSTSDGSS